MRNGKFSLEVLPVLVGSFTLTSRNGDGWITDYAQTPQSRLNQIWKAHHKLHKVGTPYRLLKSDGYWRFERAITSAVLCCYIRQCWLAKVGIWIRIVSLGTELESLSPACLCSNSNRERLITVVPLTVKELESVRIIKCIERGTSCLSYWELRCIGFGLWSRSGSITFWKETKIGHGNFHTDIHKQPWDACLLVGSNRTRIQGKDDSTAE